MSLRLPPSDSPIRELIDLNQLASLSAPAERQKLPTLTQARELARRTFEADRAAKSVNILVLLMDGSLELVSYGPRGGRQTLWKFGQL